jgi:DNA-binding CsgD family transcriptional regulator
MNPAPIERLTERERQCLRLVADGYSTKQIARIAEISASRCAKTIDSANRKLGVSSRMDAARLLAEHEGRGVNIIPGMTLPLPHQASHSTTGPSTGDAAGSRNLREERTRFVHSLDSDAFSWRLREGGRLNDLTTRNRIVLIVLLSAVGMIGVGAIATGLGSVAERIIIVPSTGR